MRTRNPRNEPEVLHVLGFGRRRTRAKKGHQDRNHTLTRMSLSEAGRWLGISRHVAYSTEKRALKKLRAALADLEGELS